MKKKLQITACALFITAIPLSIAFTVGEKNFSISKSKADNDYSLSLNSSNKYLSGDQVAIATNAGNGAYVNFQYSNVSQSDSGHVVLESGGTLTNINPLTSLSYLADK